MHRFTRQVQTLRESTSFSCHTSLHTPRYQPYPNSIKHCKSDKLVFIYLSVPRLNLFVQVVLKVEFYC